MCIKRSQPPPHVTRSMLALAYLFMYIAATLDILRVRGVSEERGGNELG